MLYEAVRILESLLLKIPLYLFKIDYYIVISIMYSTQQVLYETAFAMSDIAPHFHIHGVHPRRLIPVDVPLSTLHLETPAVVIVECSDDAPDLLEMLSSVSILCASHYMIHCIESRLLSRGELS